MNRRSFLTGMLQAGVACMALPAALTYARKWKRVEDLFVPESSATIYYGKLIQNGVVGDVRLADNFSRIEVFDGQNWVEVAVRMVHACDKP